MASRTLSFAARYTRATLGALYHLTAGVTTSDGRAWIAQAASDAPFWKGPALKLPPVAPDALTSDRTPIVLRALERRPGNVTVLESVTLARLVRDRQPASLFEIGTFDGRTTLTLAANAPDDAIVRTLDLPPDPKPALAVERADAALFRDDLSGLRIVGSDLEGRIQRLRGDSATFDFSPYRADFIFVDGAHSYEYVLQDAYTALGMVRSGASVVVFHDYGQWPGVTRALEELWATDPEFAPLRWVEGTSLAVLERGH